MSQCQLPNLSYKPPNVIGPIYLIAAVVNRGSTQNAFSLKLVVLLTSSHLSARRVAKLYLVIQIQGSQLN